jgi:hypothetical protein
MQPQHNSAFENEPIRSRNPSLGRLRQSWEHGRANGKEKRRSLAERRQNVFTKISDSGKNLRNKIGRKRRQTAPDLAVTAIGGTLDHPIEETSAEPELVSRIETMQAVEQMTPAELAQAIEDAETNLATQHYDLSILYERQRVLNSENSQQ